MTELEDGAAPDPAPASIRKTIVPEEIEAHPFYQDVIRIAEEKGLDLTDVASIPRIVSEIEGGQNGDARLILVLSLILERLTHHKETLERLALLESPADDSIYEE